MTIDVPTFRARYPEFADPKLTDAQITIVLDDAQCDFSRSKLSNNVCGTNIYERIIFALAAHAGQLSAGRAKGNTAGGGAVTNKTVGSVSVGYNRAASSSSIEDFYQQTIYGQTYLQLLYQYCPGYRV